MNQPNPCVWCRLSCFLVSAVEVASKLAFLRDCLDALSVGSVAAEFEAEEWRGVELCLSDALGMAGRPRCSAVNHATSTLAIPAVVFSQYAVQCTFPSKWCAACVASGTPQHRKEVR